MNRVVLMSLDWKAVLRKEDVPSWPMEWSPKLAPAFYHDGALYLQTDQWDTHDGKKWQVYLLAPAL